MPKSMRSEVIDHSSDAGFRAWVELAEEMLADAGLVRTSDAGQINPASATRPGTNTVAGYAIWRFNDLLQGVAPVFLKVSYGTSSSATLPSITVQVGSGSDGTGGLTGEVSSEYRNARNGVSPLPSLCFSVANAWGASLVLGTVAGATTGFGVGFGFAVHRTVDAAGVPTADGVMLNINAASGASGAGEGYVEFIQRVPVVSIRTMRGGDICHLPFGLADYFVGASPQIFPVWCALPKVRPMAFMAVAPSASAPGAGQSFGMAIVGAQQRTYMSVGSVFGRHYNTSVANTPCTSFVLWED